MVTAKARLKPVEQLPEWARCCEEAIQAYREQTSKLGVLIIVPQTIFIISVVDCKSCRLSVDDVKGVRVLGTPGLPVIPFDFIDIQEGE